METPEFIRQWGLALGAFFIVSMALPLPARDYEISAHAALTNAIISKYNAAFPDAEIDDAFRFDLIRGSKEEDDGSRSLNHFYDPVHNRGLSFGGKSWMSSKKWAMADDMNEFTWAKGLDAYARGDNHRAFLILGHVLHLLEDAGVPEHVRNDMHAMDSPYEAFTKTLVPVLNTASPLLLATVPAYFDAMAVYANSGFYSADTIDEKDYLQPKPDFVAPEGKYMYGFKNDADGNKYHLVQYVNGDKKLKFINKDNGKILSDYWRLLSAKTIRYGAGMTHLFIIEGEKLKKERAVAERAKQSKSIYAALASVVDVFTSTAESVGESDGLTEAASVALDGTAGDTPITPTKASASVASPSKGNAAEVKKSSITSVASPANKKITIKTPPPKACGYAKTVTPTHGPVIINEVAWMGSKVSASNEWIELKNISDAPAVVSGWQMLSKRGNITIVLPHGAVIPAGGFYLLERTDDNSVPNIPADFIYVGSLANSDDGLRLMDGNCKAADEADGSPSWPAGNATGRRTMERASDFSWHDYNGAGTNNIFGTPRAENSAPPLIRAGSARGGSVSSAPVAAAPTPSSQSASAAEPVIAAPARQFARGDVVINEFLFDADGVDAGREFVELYNATDAAVGLAGWSLQVKSGAVNTIKKKNFDDGLAIPANGCFLIWLGAPLPDARPQFVWGSGTLNNTAATIYVSAGTDMVQGADDASVVDSIAYTVASIPGFSAGMSVERVGETNMVRARSVPSPNSCVRLADNEPIPAYGSARAGAEKSTTPFTIPSVSFYKNPDGAGSRIDIAWTNYPFVPPTDAGTWSGLAFYLNSAPDGKKYLTTDDQLSTGSDAALRVQYPMIRAGPSPMENVVVFPDTRERMNTDDILPGTAYNYDALASDGAAHITTPTEGQKGDYITIGYYRFSHGGGGAQNMDLVYVDPKRWQFK